MNIKELYQGAEALPWKELPICVRSNQDSAIVLHSVNILPELINAMASMLAYNCIYGASRSDEHRKLLDAFHRACNPDPNMKFQPLKDVDEVGPVQSAQELETAFRKTIGTDSADKHTKLELQCQEMACIIGDIQGSLKILVSQLATIEFNARKT